MYNKYGDDMKRINNKGMTVVELVLSFAILIILVLGMLRLVLEVKDTMYEEQVYKDLTEYSSNLNYVIHKDFLNNNVNDAVYVDPGYENCPNEEDIMCYTFTFDYPFEDGTYEKNIVVNFKSNTINYGKTLYQVPYKDEVIIANVNNIYFEDGKCNTNAIIDNDDNFIKIQIPIYYREDYHCDHAFGLNIIHPIGV